MVRGSREQPNDGQVVHCSILIKTNGHVHRTTVDKEIYTRRTGWLLCLPVDFGARLRDVRYSDIGNHMWCRVYRRTGLCSHQRDDEAPHYEDGDGEEEGNFWELHVYVVSLHYSTVLG